MYYIPIKSLIGGENTMEEFNLPNIADEKSTLKTIRIKISTLQKIEELSKKSNISVNRLLNECIEYALKNLKKEDLNHK